MTLKEKIMKRGPQYRRDPDPGIPDILTGAYMNFGGARPQKQNLTPISQEEADMITKNAGGFAARFKPTSGEASAFNVGDIGRYYTGIDPNQSEFLINQNGIPLSYLSGHEGVHAYHLTPNEGIGNQGYMPTGNPNFQDERTPGGRENWLANNYPEWVRNQEREASIAGIRKMLQERAMKGKK
jgi:hypothetical protein